MREFDTFPMPSLVASVPSHSRSRVMIQQAKRPSHWTTPEGMKYLGPHDSNEPMDVTVVLRRRSDAAPTPAQWPQTPRLTRIQFAEQHGADPADVESLRGFAHQHGLTETGYDQRRRV